MAVERGQEGVSLAPIEIAQERHVAFVVAALEGLLDDLLVVIGGPEVMISFQLQDRFDQSPG